MRFAQFTTSLLAFATATRAAMSSDTVIVNIKEVTELSAETNAFATRINIINFLLNAPLLANYFGRIVTLVLNDIAAMGEMDKRALEARRECLNGVNEEKCLRDTGEIMEKPDQSIWRQKRQAAPPFTRENQQAICAAFRGFVKVHQALLATVIGKHGLLSLTPSTRAIASVLQELERVVDILAFGIIDLVPVCAQGATQDKNALDVSLRLAVKTYN